MSRDSEVREAIEAIPTWMMQGQHSLIDRATVLAILDRSSEAAPTGWDEAMQDPAFVASLERGLADLAAGRVKPYVPASEAAPTDHTFRAADGSVHCRCGLAKAQALASEAAPVVGLSPEGLTQAILDATEGGLRYAEPFDFAVAILARLTQTRTLGEAG